MEFLRIVEFWFLMRVLFLLENFDVDKMNKEGADKENAYNRQITEEPEGSTKQEHEFGSGI